MKKVPVTLAFISLLFSNCVKDDIKKEKLSQTLKAKTFQISTPKGWALTEDQGIQKISA